MWAGPVISEQNGPGAHRAAKRLRAAGNVLVLEDGTKVQVVLAGEHLGNMIAGSGSMAPTVRARRHKAISALMKLKRKVLCNAHLPEALRGSCATSRS